MIQIEMIPAEQGDSFLIHFDNNTNILIDMGYKTTYQSYIRNRLLRLKRHNQCIDLLIITHIDQDHIDGAIEFFKENKDANNPNIIEVKEIWYNCFRHLSKHSKVDGELPDKMKSELEKIVFKNSLDFKHYETKQKTISISQGNTLAGYLYQYGYKNRWNTSFEGNAVSINTKQFISINEIQFILLSPNNQKLDLLSRKWLKYLRQVDNKFIITNDELYDKAYESYVKQLVDVDSYERCISNKNYSLKRLLEQDIISQEKKDSSKSNGSALAFVMLYKKKKMLFLSDAHEGIILDGLKKYKQKYGNLDFDIIKIAHHGSIKNNFDWIEYANGKKYLFSTNGEGTDHPSLKVIAKILKTNNMFKELYFNYQIAKIKNEICDPILEKKYKYNVCNENTMIEV